MAKRAKIVKVKLPAGDALVPVRKVREGVILICDGGFTCLKAGAKRMVFRDTEKKMVLKTSPNNLNGTMVNLPLNHRDRLYIRCNDKRHYLDGQYSADGKSYVGFWLFSK